MTTNRVAQKLERGASLVEFAVLLPFLVLLLFGVIEFAWVFAQHLDVRQGTREAARLMSVNYPAGRSSAMRNATDTSLLVAAICGTLDDPTGVEVTLQSSGGLDDPGTAALTAPGETLTSIFAWALPPTLTLSSEVETRLQLPATWTDTVSQTCP
jgi:Flp pilus assembly protein TadG